MQAAEREARQQRWMVWHTAALPLMKKFPDARGFIDPGVAKAANENPGAATFLALRRFGDDKPPAWVLRKFGLPAEV